MRRPPAVSGVRRVRDVGAALCLVRAGRPVLWLRAMPKWVPILQPDGGVDITASDAGYMTLGELTGLGDSAFSMASSEQMGAYVSYLDWRGCGRRMGWE